MRKIFILAITILYFGNANAQELNFQISVNTPKLQTADPKLFEELRTAMLDFLNNQKWTSDTYETKERIDCNIQLTITSEEGSNGFTADLAIQAVRPVYGSSYETPLLSHVDKDVAFTYTQFQPLIYTENNFQDNLTSILTFYVYVILGMDYDSFSLYGGDPHFQTAQQILTTVPSNSPFQGWQAKDSNRNRYWMIENLLTPRVRPYRQAMYDYHRLGLDRMSEFSDSGRAKISEALTQIGKVYDNVPDSMILQMFSNAKGNEIVDIFKGGTSSEKSKVYPIMIKVDPANSTRYRAIR